MMNIRYFFDSYAIMEILDGNPNYNNYTNSEIILTKLNLFEVYSNILRNSSENEAERIFEKYSLHVVDYDNEVIKESAKILIKYRERKISMTDCIGYIIAKKLEIRFLTGDKEFEDLDNVEFVK